jgi:septal ring factor EnvC (AmiA/AmiB activator)
MQFKLLLILLTLTLSSIGAFYGFNYYNSNLPIETTNQEVTDSKFKEEIDKFKTEIETKNTEIKNLTSKIETLEKEILGYKNQISNKDSEILNLKKNLSSKESDLDKLDSKLTKQEYCNKMNEYSQLSSSLQFRLSGESGGNGCSTAYASHIGSNTEKAYDYVNGWYKNYKDTGSLYYKKNPDLCLYDVEKMLSKLKDRRDKYREYKQKCE